MFLLRTLVLRRLGPLGLALTAYDVWRRIPPRRRRQLLAHGRRQGRRVVSRAQELRAGRGV